jgi:glycosyltransferase involved in cell wall biosynthesis
MRSNLTTIITGTYNKHEFLPDAAKSVLQQTNPNWRWWLVLDDAEEETKEIAYNLSSEDNRITCFEEKVKERNPWTNNREAFIRNLYYPRVATKYLCWLSDDDILEPNFLNLLTLKIDDENGHIAYGFSEALIKSDGNWKILRTHCPHENLGLGYVTQPFTMIDGGQFIQTKESFELLNWRFPTDFTGLGYGPNLLDAIYMKELAQKFTFYRVPVKVYTKRMTYLSTYEKGEK